MQQSCGLLLAAGWTAATPRPFQRLIPGVLMCNAQLIFMMLASDDVQKVVPDRLVPFCLVFAGLMIVLTVNFRAISNNPIFQS